MDYIPTKRAPRRLWLQNLSDQITVEGPKAGMTAGEASPLTTIVDGHIAKMEATDAPRTALVGARAATSPPFAMPAAWAMSSGSCICSTAERSEQPQREPAGD